MKRELEQELERRIRALGNCQFPRDAIGQMLDEGLIRDPKQAWRTLEKWCRRGRYEYGVSIDLGWFIGEAEGETVKAEKPTT